MNIELTSGRNRELFLQISDGRSIAPADGNDKESEQLKELARLGCCECVRHWEGDEKKPPRSVTLRLHDPHVEILAGAVETLHRVARNLGVLE